MKKFLFIFILGILIFSVSAQVNIGETPGEVAGVVLQDPLVALGLRGNLTNFTSLTDTPSSYAGAGGNCVAVNAGETDLEFIVCSSGAGNPFDQILNISSNVTFDGVNVTRMLEVNGTFDLEHTATTNDDHAVELDCSSGVFGDVKCLFIDYITGAITDGEDEEIIFINLDQFSALGGDISAFEIVTTEGGANVTGLEVGVQVHPIQQLSGIFTDMDSALNNTDDVLTQFTTIGDDIPIFAFDNDYVTIGNDVKFEEIEWILDTVAGGAGISPAFYFSTGVGTWGEFVPADGTNGMRDTGIIIWLDSDIPGWVVGLDSEFLIRINRTQNNIPTVPIESLVQIAEATQFFWNRDAELLVDSVNVTGGGVNFEDDVNATFGTMRDATIRSDGTKLLIDPGFLIPGTGTIQFNNVMGPTISAPTNIELQYKSIGLGARHIFLVLTLEIMRFTNVGVVFNEGGAASVDVRAETDNIEDALFLDSGQDTFAVNVSTTFIKNTTFKELMNLERTDQTISEGNITATSSYIRLDTEGGGATDNLYNINGGTMGSVLILQTTNNGRDVVLVDDEAGGNLDLSGNFTLSNSRRRVTLLFDGSSWFELSSSNN